MIIRKPMKSLKTRLAAGVLTAGLAGAAETSFAAAADPFALYGSEIRFNVLMDGSPVGSHVVSFDKTEDGLKVRSDFNIGVKFLFFSAYEFSYRSDATWRGGKLADLSARIDDNGELTVVNAVNAGNKLIIEGPKGRHEAAAEIFPTNHWNPAVLNTRLGVVLNTLTGRPNEVMIVKGDEETVETGAGPRVATRYDYQGELRNRVWYDKAGRWVRMKFQAKGGQTIEYVCEICGPGGQKLTGRETDGRYIR